jgi:hypothetical protein
VARGGNDDCGWVRGKIHRHGNQIADIASSFSLRHSDGLGNQSESDIAKPNFDSHTALRVPGSVRGYLS